MKYLLLLLIAFSSTAGLPPTSSKGDGETTFKTTFKTDYGDIPLTRSGTTMTIGTIPISMGGTGSTLQNFVDLTTSQSIAGEKFFNGSGALDLVKVDHSGTGDGVDVNHAGAGNAIKVTHSGSGDALNIVNTGTGDAVDVTGNGKFTGTVTASNVSGSTSGTNTGDQDLFNYVDKTTVQTITASKTFSTTGGVSGTFITHNGTADALLVDQQGTGLALNVNGDSQILGDLQLTGTATFSNTIVGSISGNAATVTTNANLTGDVTSVGNATTYTTVPISKGGTGATTKAPAFDALSPMTTLGDTIYGGVSGTGTRLPIGSNGQYMSIAAGVPSWVSTTPNAPRLAILRDEKTAGTAGGACTSATWNVRTLNVLEDPTSIVTSLSSNQFTLPAGTYRFTGSAPVYNTGYHKIAIENSTDGTKPLFGSAEYSYQTTTRSFMSGIVTIAAPKSFYFAHNSNGCTGSGNDFGLPASLGAVEIYAILEIEKL